MSNIINYGIENKNGILVVDSRILTKYSELGYAKLVTTAIDEEHTREHLKWTHKGRLFVYNLLKEDNILPLLEREENN